ncbi:hypothetical protein CC86DRAFT_465698 [Ophiobolus disseminans]|uniref:Uncharacterized protein n=1 Tax=Ophiobolus disseminans TaxID=1469910 RepID=A0A6A7A555_9PLEO|nr:hypothetical protein CC86DRAFT_465698 [Ophiobolus disseminans]
MDNTTTPQQPYLDSPPSPPSTTPTPHTSPSSSDSSTTIKPLPPLPVSTTFTEPYRDDPSEPTNHTYRDDPSSPPHNIPHFYTDSTPLSTPTDENIPLAHFLHTYPAEAPPSYSVAIRQTRDTLIQYIPNNTYTPQYVHGRNVFFEIDEESGEVVGRTDDVRHGVEKVVAMFVVAIVLLVLSGILAWMALGGVS